jgi:hypothetical protein
VRVSSVVRKRRPPLFRFTLDGFNPEVTMCRMLLALVVVALVPGAVRANAGPPKGKVIPVELTITTDKEYPEYNFYLVGEKPVPVTFDPKTPIVLKDKPGTQRTYRLYGIPKGSEKPFDTDEKLVRALTVNGEIKGRVQVEEYLEAHVRVPEADKRTRIVRESRVTKIDTKTGFIVLTTKDVEPKKDGGKKDSPDEDESPGATAYTPRGGLFVAGLSAALAVTLGGLWFLGRARRKV